MTFAPSDLTGLRIWLRAKDLGSGGSNVTTWSDQSGQANNATSSGTAPTVAASSTPGGGKSVALGGRPLNLVRAPNINALISSATASSEPAGSSFNAAKAIDGDKTGTRWLGSDSTGGSPQWLRLNMAAATVLTYYKIWGHPSSTSYNPTDWKFQGTNDGTFATWTDLDTRSSITWSSTSDTKEFTFSNSTAYSWYRILITGNVSATDFTCISEIIVQPEADVAELWVVVKADSTTGNTNSWQFGNSGQTTLYPWSNGQVVDNFGVTGHSDLWTPTLSVNNWRLYRVKSNAGVMDIWLDNTTQKHKTGLTSGWDATPQVSIDFAGNIAEMALFFGTELTSGDVANLITYFNTEHGLSVSGGTVNVQPPAASLVIDANAPTVYVAVPKASLVIDANAPVLSPPNVQPPKAAIALNAPDPTVFVAVPKASIALSAPDPAVFFGPVSVPKASIVLDAGAPLVIGPIVNTSMEIHGAGSADITDLITVVATSMQMHGAGRASMRIPLDWDADPRTGRPQWKFLVASAPHLGGELLCQLELRSEPIEEDLEAVTSGTFAVRTLDPKRSLIEPVTTWLHIYRGRHHMGGGPILRGQQSEDGTITTYPWRDPRWYLSGVMRPIHQIPRRDLLLNGDFTQGLNYWTGGYDAGTIPALAPITTVVDSDFKPGGKSMQITGADKTQLITSEVATASVFVPNSSSYLPGGEAQIQAVGTAIPDGSTVQIIGHTANDGTGSGLTLSLNRALAAKSTLLTQDPTLTFQLPSSLWPHDVTSGNVVGRGYYQPLASNSTPAGMAQNRRVTISYQGTQTALGSAQWRKQTVRVTAETQRKVRLSPVGMFKITDWIGANLAGLAARVEVRKVGAPSTDDPTSKADVEMTEETPRERWMSTTQLEGNLEVEIPAGTAQYDVTLFLYAPAGTIEWTDVHLYPDDGLYFYGVDQATIAQTLIEHAQDPAKGWADLGIGTRTPLTGVVRDKEYPYYAMRPTDVALAELTQLYRGLDMSIEVTPTSATFVTHFPRRGTTSDLVLRYGGNVIRWEPASTNDVASLVIAQADGTGIGRPEQYAIDDVSLGGMRLATIVNAENETPLNELDELAVLTLARAKRPVPAYWVTVPASHASEVLSRLQMGDSCRLVLPDLDGGVRLVKRITDPNTDTLRQLMALED